MTLELTISTLNRLSETAFPLRPQFSFLASRTCSYDHDETVTGLAEQLSEFWRDSKLADDDVARLSEPAMVGIMAARLGMETKIQLCQLAIKWFLLEKRRKENAACIIQSLTIHGIHHNLVYAVRTAIWNYTTKPSMNSSTILEIQPSGKLVLHLRDKASFNGDTVNEYIFLAQEYLQLTQEALTVSFEVMRQYDYNQLREGELAEPVSQYKISGYNREKNPNPWVFSGKFSVPFLRFQEMNEQIERNKRQGWAKKVEDIDYYALGCAREEKKLLDLGEEELDEQLKFEKERTISTSSSSSSFQSSTGSYPIDRSESPVFEMDRLAIRVRE